MRPAWPRAARPRARSRRVGPQPLSLSSATCSAAGGSSPARREVAGAGDPEEGGGVEDVRADHLRRREREDEQHHEPEEGAAADRGQTDDEAADRAGEEGDLLVPTREQERRVALRSARDERLHGEADAACDERDPEDDRRGVLEALAVRVLEPGREPDAEKGERS